MSKTFFLDIDGTLVKLHDSGNNGPTAQMFNKPEILPGVLEKINKWHNENCKIILTTARKESDREQTIQQLRELGITYDLLIMGLPHGERIVINDCKNDIPRAIAINVKTNEGFENINI